MSAYINITKDNLEEVQNQVNELLGNLNELKDLYADYVYTIQRDKSNIDYSGWQDDVSTEVQNFADTDIDAAMEKVQTDLESKGFQSLIYVTEKILEQLGYCIKAKAQLDTYNTRLEELKARRDAETNYSSLYSSGQASQAYINYMNQLDSAITKVQGYITKLNTEIDNMITRIQEFFRKLSEIKFGDVVRNLAVISTYTQTAAPEVPTDPGTAAKEPVEVEQEAAKEEPDSKDPIVEEPPEEVVQEAEEKQDSPEVIEKDPRASFIEQNAGIFGSAEAAGEYYDSQIKSGKKWDGGKWVDEKVEQTSDPRASFIEQNAGIFESAEAAGEYYDSQIKSGKKWDGEKWVDGKVESTRDPRASFIEQNAGIFESAEAAGEYYDSQINLGKKWDGEKWIPSSGENQVLSGISTVGYDGASYGRIGAVGASDGLEGTGVLFRTKEAEDYNTKIILEDGRTVYIREEDKDLVDLYLRNFSDYWDSKNHGGAPAPKFVKYSDLALEEKPANYSRYWDSINHENYERPSYVPFEDLTSSEQELVQALQRPNAYYLKIPADSVVEYGNKSQALAVGSTVTLSPNDTSTGLMIEGIDTGISPQNISDLRISTKTYEKLKLKKEAGYVTIPTNTVAIGNGPETAIIPGKFYRMIIPNPETSQPMELWVNFGDAQLDEIPHDLPYNSLSVLVSGNKGQILEESDLDLLSQFSYKQVPVSECIEKYP